MIDSDSSSQRRALHVGTKIMSRLYKKAIKHLSSEETLFYQSKNLQGKRELPIISLLLCDNFKEIVKNRHINTTVAQ